MQTLVRSLYLDPPVDLEVDCPPPPPEAEKVLFAAVFANSPPIRPGAPEFPSDFCPANAGFIALAEGSGNSSLFGEFTWSERYCTVPPGRLVPHRDGRPGRLRLRSADGSRRRKHTADRRGKQWSLERASVHVAGVHTVARAFL